MKKILAMWSGAVLMVSAGCPFPPATEAPVVSGGGAAIVGRLVTTGGSAKLQSVTQPGGCPAVVVTLDGAPATIVFDEDCGFLVTGVRPTAVLELRVELPALGISGTVEIQQVVEGELIEIEVESSDVALSLAVLRRAEPVASITLPVVITGNNVTLQIGSGVYEQELTVDGNNFTLIGPTRDDCDGSDWSRISGPVVVSGNNATFRNIALDGSVEVRGNNARFINCCFDGELLVFGNRVGIVRE